MSNSTKEDIKYYLSVFEDIVIDAKKFACRVDMMGEKSLVDKMLKTAEAAESVVDHITEGLNG